ncbi:hypothetical protein AAVH_36216 [Aphelenchoides avenae]|nr:hypothetical protein AAVH_36216 [Aphelenchus avenae]
MLQFVVQLSFLVVGYGSFFVDRQAAAVGLSMSTYATGALCLSPPICAFSMSGSLRTAYVEMHFPFVTGTTIFFGTAKVVPLTRLTIPGSVGENVT